jgi:predicted amidohydrolase
MKVAVGQMSVSNDKDSNLATIEELCKQAFEAGAKLICFPECCMYASQDEKQSFVDIAEPLNGPFVTALKRFANLYSICIVAGIFESSVDAARVYNTVVVIDENGQIKDPYRKIHLYDAFGTKESDRVIAGDGNTLVFQAGGLTFGVMTCYDLRFPELARHLSFQGAHAILLPAAWRPGPMKEAHLEILARARAIENNVYMIVAAQVGYNCCGNSMVVDPMGVIQASVANNECLLVSEIGRQRIDEVREVSPTLQNRRTDLYARWRDTNQRWYDDVSTETT